MYYGFHSLIIWFDMNRHIYTNTHMNNSTSDMFVYWPCIMFVVIIEDMLNNCMLLLYQRDMNNSLGSLVS